MSSSIPSSTGISTSSPYDSRAKKHKVKKGSRRIQVDLHVDPNSNSNNACSEKYGANSSDLDPKFVNQSSLTSSQSSDRSDNNSSNLWLWTAEQQLSGPIRHAHQLKNVFGDKSTSRSEDMVHISPYMSKVGKNVSTGMMSKTADNNKANTYTVCNTNFAKPVLNANPNHSTSLPSSFQTEADDDQSHSSDTRKFKRKAKDMEYSFVNKKISIEPATEGIKSNLAERYRQLQG